MPLLLQNGDYLLLQSGDKLLLQDETAGSGSPFPIIFQQAGTMNIIDIVKKGSTDRSVTIRIIDSTTGLPETAVEHNTSGIDLWYRREGATKQSITEAPLTALDDAHSDGGIEHIGDGYYRLDLPDAAFLTGANHVDIGGTVTGMIVIGGRVKLVNYDPEDAVRLGLTALPNAAADAAGGLPISVAGGLAMDTLASDLTAIKKNAFIGIEFAIGTVTSQTEFILTGGPANDIDNVMAIFFDQSASDAPVVAEGSYVGSTGTLTLTAATPITVTTSDTVTLVAVAATTSSVNVTSWGGTAVGSVTLPANVTQISGDSTAADNLEAACDGTGFNIGGGSVVAASVTGAVGSVTGNVGGNVTGSVGSVLGGINTTSGTITTLDALDTAQDSQHSTTQGLVTTVDTVADATKVIADKLNTALESDGAAGYQFTILALENAPSGSGASASAIADAVWDEALSGHATAGTAGKAAADAAALLTTALADAYAAHGNAPTLQQAIMWIHQSLDERSASGTTITVKKIDGTTAGTLTVDDATDPTSVTRAT